MNEKKQVIRNSAVGLVQLFLTAILTLTSVPIFISKLGLEAYGVFAVLSVIGNLSVFTNLGLNQSLIVYLSQQGRSKESDYDIVVTAIFLSCFAIGIGIMVVLFRGFIVENLLSIPEKYVVASKSLLIYLVIANGFLLVGQTFTSIIDSVQKIYITNLYQFAFGLIYWGGIIAVVTFGGGLEEIGMLIVMAVVIWFVAVLITSLKIWGKIRLKGISVNFMPTLQKQLQYGSKIYLSGLVGFLFEPLSKILISTFIGVHIVAVFEIGLKIRTQISSILMKAFYPVFPVISAMNEGLKLNELIKDFSKKIQLLVIPIIISVLFVMPYLLMLWLGMDNIQQITLFVVTLTASFLALSPVVLPAYNYFAAKNMAEINVWAQLSSVIVNVLVFLGTYKFIDMYAILLSNTAGYLASFSVLKYNQIKYSGNPIDWYYVRKLAILFLFVFLPCVCFSYLDINEMFRAVLSILTVILFFILGIRFLNILTKDDIIRYFGTIPFLERVFLKILITG